MEVSSIKVNNKFWFQAKFLNGTILSTGAITQDYIDWVYRETFYLATMPRSGTNMLTYFFNYFHMALSGELDFTQEITAPKESVKTGWMGLLNPTLNFKWFLISHNFCPGFESLCNGEYRKKWNNVFKHMFNYSDSNYIYLIEQFRNCLYPNLNEDVKIIFLYRNPLDQVISLSRHMKNLIVPPFYDVSLNTIESKLTFINQYLQMYLTYDYMRKLYPNNIKFISYEQLVVNPKKVLTEILEYYNFDLSLDNRMELFEKTLSLIQPKALKELEKKMGRTLAGDQLLHSGESHIRSGKTGTWKDAFSEEDLCIIEKRFNEFDLTLNQFDGIDLSFNKGQLKEINLEHIINKIENYISEMQEAPLLSFIEPILVENGYAGSNYNIILFQGCYYGVPQSLGSVNFFSDERLNEQIIIHKNLNLVKQSIHTPILIEENTNNSGYNIIFFRGFYYGVPQSLGTVNFFSEKPLNEKIAINKKLELVKDKIQLLLKG